MEYTAFPTVDEHTNEPTVEDLSKELEHIFDAPLEETSQAPAESEVPGTLAAPVEAPVDEDEDLFGSAEGEGEPHDVAQPHGDPEREFTPSNAKDLTRDSDRELKNK